MKKLTQNVNKDKFLNDLPKVNPQFSKWLTRHTNYQSCNIGEIVPIYYDEVLPNEKRKVTMSMISHITTPTAPIFNSVYTEIRAFVVPLRLCADLLNGYSTRKSPFVKVFGEDPASTSSDVIVPLSSQELPSFSISHQFITDVSTYVAAAAGAGNRNNIIDSLDSFSGVKSELAEMNFLNLAAYELIYQRHYRNENFEAATASPLYRLLFNAYTSSKASVSLGATFTYEMASREKDYFTGMKPFTQKGDAIKVSLTGPAPVKVADSLHSMGGQIRLSDQNGNPTGTGNGGSLEYSSAGYVNGIDNATSLGASKQLSYSNLVADLGSVNGISIEELRLLIKTQELLEKDAMYGSLYAESLNAHFGTCPLDLTLSDPQEIYRTTITSQMQAIFQTSSTASESSILGTVGANSTTQTDPFVILPETEFKEHCILMICAVHKLQNVYASHKFRPKFLFKKSRFDFFTPELDALGYQPISNKEMVSSSSAIAGYNEAFAEYRYKFNKAHGRLYTDFKYWCPNISDQYSSLAALYKEDPSILDESLSVLSSAAPQFYDAWGFEEVNTKPMSLHSIPGMDGVI